MLLVLGTRNVKKRQEIVEILGDLGLELRDLSAWPDLPEVIEDGATFEANARKKASETASALGHWVLGEDSGLVVPVLKGRPGVYSARYAGTQGDDAANNAKLLAELAPLPDDQRAAVGAQPRVEAGERVLQGQAVLDGARDRSGGHRRAAAGRQRAGDAMDDGRTRVAQRAIVIEDDDCEGAHSPADG